ncbi:uncharacterized protein BP5553_02888 [Venustampulla echinocandica]|uniref:Uncharacterized protein n=1 Tax=Venustampulla echinocandica TaxID=2656787 RepID=A0A370TSS5_9HELO|nr:uncharacterized protein BP5553_02888 [Venustampulla echinocandica]RDL38548.1 hypothetical protein BP5553_02888 [Venustampulla echinocandica]
MNHYTACLTRHPKIVASVLVIGCPVTYLLYLHRSLSRTTSRTSKQGLLTESTSHSISSIPSSDLTSEYFMVHDRAYKSIPASLFPALGQEELLTTYLRHTLSLFSSRFPQAYLIRMVSTPEEKRTFKHDYIRALDFKEGDLVCGAYRVAVRTKGKVEFEIKTMGIVKGGRMVISIEEKADEWECSSETVMWKRVGEKSPMPLERGILKWSHELASWWLLDSGTRYLMGLKKQS